jgi:putrescine transport system substrate-binding protein
MREWVLRATLAVAMTMAGATIASAQGILNIYNWNDYIAPETIARFERETGIKITYDVYDSNEILDAKLRTKRSGYDLVVPSATPFLASQIPAKLYQPLDRAKLRNYGNLDPAVMAQLARHDPGNRHAIPWMLGTTGIGYNIDRVTALMPDAPVTSLKMLLDPAIVQKFAGCGVTILDSPTDVIPAALAYLGLNPDSQTEADLTKATDALVKVRRAVRKWDSADYINALANGDSCLVIGYSGDIKQAAKRAAEAKRGVRVGYSIPAEGGQLGIDSWAIPVDARNVNNAHRFLDFVLQPDIAAQNTNAVGYANAVPASLPMVDAAIRNDPGIYPPEEVAKRIYSVSPPTRSYERARTRAWTRVTTGR